MHLEHQNIPASFEWIPLLGLVAQLVVSLIADPRVASLTPVRSHALVEIDCEIFSMVILLLPLIQDGLMSVTRESMCVKYSLTT